MRKRTGNIWGTDKCHICGKAHDKQEGRLDSNGCEYLRCPIAGTKFDANLHLEWKCLLKVKLKEPQYDYQSKKFQAKHISTDAVLRIMEQAGGPCTWYSLPTSNSLSFKLGVQHGQEKVVLAKMRSLWRQGVVRGCTCGCRGDFEILN